MIKIGVCEDESIWRSHIEEVVKKFFKIKEEVLLLKSYSGGEALLCGYEGLDLVFFDIEMEGIDGIETAKRLRRMDSKVEIVFLTSHLEVMQEAFKVKPFRFLDKEFNFETIEECLKSYLNEKKSFIDIFLDVKGETIILNTKDIIMIEATKNGSIIYCRDKEIFSRKTLNEWEDKVENLNFFRCHKSYIVHFFSIKSISERVKLLQGYEAEVSRRRSKELIDKYFEYVEVNAR